MIPVAPATSAKFDDNGAARPFAGLSVVAPIVDDGARAALAGLLARLAAEPDAAAHALLPQASMHVTLCRGVNDQRRLAGEWVAEVPLAAPLETVGDRLAERLAAISLPALFAVAATEIFINASGEIQVRVDGVDAPGQQALHAARRRLAEAMRRPLPTDPGPFHVTLSYRVRPAEAAQEMRLAERLRTLWGEAAARLAAFSIGPAALCAYDDMTLFRHRLVLAAEAGAGSEPR